jgi:hypothetical protein
MDLLNIKCLKIIKERRREIGWGPRWEADTKMKENERSSVIDVVSHVLHRHFE